MYILYIPMFPVPVKKFNAIKDGKPEKERCKIISKTKENKGQNSEDYLELKEGKKENKEKKKI